jgi:hypothetical protein
MQEFIHRKNLENYRKLLAETEDDAERSRIQKLLTEEEANEAPPPEKKEDGLP